MAVNLFWQVAPVAWTCLTRGGLGLGLASSVGVSLGCTLGCRSPSDCQVSWACDSFRVWDSVYRVHCEAQLRLQ